MSLTLRNRVFETTSSTGTGSYLLAGVVNASCRPFADAGNGGLIPYLVEQGTKSEWGIGTYDSGTNTLARTTILGNYLGTTAAISWTSGTKNIYSPDLVELFNWLTFSDTFTINTITVAEAAAPATPASGFVSLYAKADGNFYQKDDAGTETALGNAGSQPLDATLTAFAALTIAANSLTIGSGADAFSQTTFAANTFPARASTGNLVAKTITDFALTILDDADGSAVRTTIGAGTGSGDALVANTLDQFANVTQTATKTLAITDNTTLAGGTHSGTNTGDQTSVSGNAGTATALATARNINGVAFDGTANITVTAAGSTLSDTVTVAKGGTGLTTVGTALQVLRTNAGATAMEWASPAGDVATDAIWDAKGDLAGGTGANTAARLAVGTDGQVLTAASGEATGLIWADPTGGSSDLSSVFLVNKNGTQQDFTTATSTKLTWSTVEFDAGAEFASDKFTATNAGKYLLQCAARVTATGTGTTSIKLHLYKNGTLYKTFQHLTALAGLTDITLEGDVVGEAAATDYFEIFVEFAGLAAGTATIGGAATDTWFCGVRLVSAAMITTADITNDAVTYAKIQNVSGTDKLLGRSSGGAGDVEEIVCTAAGRSILDDTTVDAILDTLGGATRTGTGGVVCLIAPTLTNAAETVQALTSATSVTWDMVSGAAATLTLATNATLAAPNNLRNGATYSLIVTQDGTGSRTLAYNAVFKWAGGTAPVLSTAAGAKDILTFLSDGTNLYGSILKAFS